MTTTATDPAAPRDGVDVFRAAFGALLAFASVRFVALGWVDRLYLQPRYHFAWFSWAVVPPPPLLYALFGLLALSGLGLCASVVLPRARWLYHPSVAVHLLVFTYVELLDATLYLNHYVLVTVLLAVLLCAPPPGREVPPTVRGLLLLTYATVWTWAGICKLNADWMLRGQPLSGWLATRADLPLIGPWLAHPLTGLLASWGGAAYDLGIVAALLHPRTRWPAAALGVAFHVGIWLLFPIGIFPWLMLLGIGLYLAPAPLRRPSPTSPGTLAAGLAGAALLLVPARPYLLGPDPAWTERGTRFAWRVMLVEKSGMVTYEARERGTDRRWTFRPSDELADWQHEQMRTQPDLIRQYALHLAQRLADEGHDVAIYADSWASLHGRPAQRLVRPDVDLTQPLSTLWRRGWITPLAAAPGTDTAPPPAGSP
jgi:hypothetical protein